MTTSAPWPALAERRWRTSSPAVRLLPNAYRVLNADGSIPEEGMLNAWYRGTDLRSRLGSEGVVFDAQGQAAQDSRMTTDSLKRLLAARAGGDDLDLRTAVSRAWMVRGSNVDGRNLVPDGWRLVSCRLAHLS